MKTKYSLIILGILVLTPSLADAHRSGCHRWHSCPSDTGSYVCGDLGYTSGCPKNEPSPSVTPKTKPKAVQVQVKPKQATTTPVQTLKKTIAPTSKLQATTTIASTTPLKAVVPAPTIPTDNKPTPKKSLLQRIFSFF